MEDFLKWLQQNLPRQVFWTGIIFALSLLGGSRIAELLIQLKQLRSAPKHPKDAELNALERELKITTLKEELARKGVSLPDTSPYKIDTKTLPDPNTPRLHAMSWVGHAIGSAEPAMRPINRLPRILRIPIAVALVMITSAGALVMPVMALGAFWWGAGERGVGFAIFMAVFSFALAMVFIYVAFESAVRIRGDK